MWKRIIHFVQYHNFFTIAVMMLFVGASASFAASPDLQKSVLAKTDVVRSVDNTFLVNTDFNTYDMGLKILAVTQDTDAYYVDYLYNTIVQNDYVWQPVPVKDSMKVSKKELAGRDLGLYVSDQLGQLVTQQIAYLKEVQTREKEKGASQKVIATEYSGLVGRFLGTDEKSFEGYTPVKPPPKPELAVAEPDNSGAAAVAAANAAAKEGVSLTSYGAPVVDSSVTRGELQAIIQETVRQLLSGETATTTPSSTTSPPAGTQVPPPSSGGGGSSTPPPPPVETTPPPADTTASSTPPADTTPPTATTTPPADTTASSTPPTDTTPPADTATTTTPTSPEATQGTAPVETTPPPADTSTTTPSTP